MEEVKHRRWLRIFAAVAALLIAQVTWWAMIFVKDVRLIAKLETANLALSTADRNAAYQQSLEKIQFDSVRHQIMFLSESSFFAIMACLGLYLLYRGLKAEERSREIQRNFIEVVTHESKTPLTALKLRLESAELKLCQQPAEQTFPTGETGKVVTREIGLALEEVRRLASILEKALNLNRMERQALRFEPLRLCDVVQEVVHRLDPFLKAHTVLLSLDLDPEAAVVGDPDGLQAAVQSLLENAVLYNNASEKKVTMRITSQSPKVLFTISDNGPGIGATDRAHVFERFYRAHSSGAARVPGTGLGLYIAKTVVEAHQGSLRLVDDGQPGTKFEIELPEGGG